MKIVKTILNWIRSVLCKCDLHGFPKEPQKVFSATEGVSEAAQVYVLACLAYQSRVGESRCPYCMRTKRFSYSLRHHRWEPLKH